MSAPIGEVRVEVRGDTSKVDPDIEKGLKAAAHDADDDLKVIGRDFGDAIGNSMEKELERHGPDLAHAVERGTAKNPAHISWDLDSDRDSIGRGVAKLGRSIEQEVKNLSAGGGGRGPFGKIGAAISDAIGAGFNISGRSPLIAFLIPLVGFIAELVIGAIQGVFALTAVLNALPGLIGAIILQVGVLFVAFHGLGGAIQGAFAATNADELKKALVGLTPSAQEFVKSLLPLKDLFKAFRDIIQENFFRAFGNSITVVVRALGPITYANIGRLAEALGNLGRVLVTFFADPTFVRFFTWLIVYTVRWVDDFGSALDSFLRGFANLGNAVMPFMDWLGTTLNDVIRTFGNYLSNLSTDPEFLQFLEDSKESLIALGNVLKDAVGLLASLADAVDKAGGKDTLKEISEQLKVLSGFLQSAVAVKGIEGLIHTAELLSQILVGNIIVIFALFAALEVVMEWLKNTAWPFIVGVFKSFPSYLSFLGEEIVKFFTWIGGIITDVVNAIGNFFGDIGAFILRTLFEIAGWVTTHVHDWVMIVVDWFKNLPGLIGDAVGNLWDTLYDAGKNLIGGLIRGALTMLGPLAGAISFLIQKGVKDQTPSSPAKAGPLSGKGDPKFAGQEIVNRLVAGIETEQPALASAVSNMASTVIFGPNSVQATFSGQLPTNNQAMALGGALGGGIANRLAVRDTRLAVRSMA